LLDNWANRNITEIAYKVGFNDPKYFTRCFTRQYGCSPSAFVGEDEKVDEK
jgi:AraC-like DNA-binding protein